MTLQGYGSASFAASEGHKRARANAVVVAFAAVALSVAGCSANSGVAPYELSATATESALGDFEVRGNSSMPDGGVVSVYAWSATDQPHREWFGRATVTHGAFSSIVEASTWQAQTVHFSIAIMGDPSQSAEVLSVIGPYGERLSGPTVQIGEDGERSIEAQFDVRRDAPSRT